VPAFIALLIHAVRILRKPMDRRLKQRQGGPFLLVLLAFTMLALWVDNWPSGLAASYFWGELSGVFAIYLMCWSLALATRARWLEPWFGGLDRMYFWHKRCAVVAMFALAPHVLLTGHTGHSAGANRIGDAMGALSLLGLITLVLISLPRAGRILRIPYDRWLFIHRLIGLFVLLALLHGLSIDQVIAGSALLKAVYLTVGGLGLAAYAYAELVMRHKIPTADYTIERIDRPSSQILDLHLAPTGEGVTLRAGQFIFLRIGGDDAWREHPFTVAGTSPGGHLRLTIRSLGRDTARMHARLEPGLPARVTGPYGMFDYTLGRVHQIWIAGGIGVAPFLSWLTTLAPEDAYDIDLFYSTPTESEAVYLDELRSAQQRLAPLLRVHPIFTRTHGHLTGDKVAGLAKVTPDTHVFLCGPTPMVEDLARDLHRRGVPRDYIHSEHFSFR
jgi:predicted ferric reductase